MIIEIKFKEMHLVGHFYANIMTHGVQYVTETLVDASKEIGLEVNVDKTKCMVMSRDQNAGQNHCMKIDNKPFEMLEQLKYLGTNVTNQNYIQEEIKGRLKSRNVCYLSVQNFLPSSLLSKNMKINLLRPTGHEMHQQFNIQQLYALPTLYLFVLYLSENKQRLVPLTA